jgi:hypothetical protein
MGRWPVGGGEAEELVWPREHMEKLTSISVENITSMRGKIIRKYSLLRKNEIATKA